MSHNAVFLDRDHTIIDDPGYLGDPQAVKLLPGVDLAIKSLAAAGYKVVVVTNQSGVARGLVTVATLEKIHSEMRRQLADTKAHIDAVYYCPFHPEGSVPEFAMESELRKPQPGMLLKAAGEMDLNLSRSWMVGDSGRDVEAGQRAGCRTIRLRTRPESHEPGQNADENVQADFTVRNLVDAARVILREDGKRDGSGSSVSAGVKIKTPAVKVQIRAEPKVESATPQARPLTEAESVVDDDAGDEVSAPVAQAKPASQEAKARGAGEPVSLLNVAAVAAQALAPLALVASVWNLLAGAASGQAVALALIALTLQAGALTFFVTKRRA